MFSRVLTVALLSAGTALAFATANAQTGSTTAPSATTPGAGSGSMSGTTTSPQTAQQPGSFKASNYKTKAECLTAATAAGAPSSACNSLSQ
jgi:hypothetical protein